MRRSSFAADALSQQGSGKGEEGIGKMNTHNMVDVQSQSHSGVKVLFHNYVVVAFAFIFILGFRHTMGRDNFATVWDRTIFNMRYGYEWKAGMSEILTQCHDLDKVGGQPVLTMDISKKVSLWVGSIIPDKPSFYQDKIAVNQHRIGKKRQDDILSVVGEYKEILQYIGEQYELLELPQKRLDEIKPFGQQFMCSKEWKNLCERDDRKAMQAASKLSSLFKKVVDHMKIMLKEILIAKNKAQAEYVKASPQNAQKVAEATASIKAERAEARKIQEEEERQLREDQERQNEAHDEERRAANRRGENGLELQRQQFRNDTLATEAFLHVMKEVKKGNRKSEDLFGVGRSAVAE